MYQLNITTKVNHDIIEEWILWQQEVHIPSLMSTGCFSEFSFSELLDNNDDEGKIFVTQLRFPSLKFYQDFIEEHDSALKEKTYKKWGDGLFSFRTVLRFL